MNHIKILFNWILIIILSIIIAVPIIFICGELVDYIHVHFFNGLIRNLGDDQIDYDDMVFGLVETIIIIITIWPASIWASYKIIKKRFKKNSNQSTKDHK